MNRLTSSHQEPEKLSVINKLKTERDIIELVRNDIEMVNTLKIVRDLNLPDCRIWAWFIRNKIWDYIHWYWPKTTNPDIDICYFDSSNLDENNEKIVENNIKKKYLLEKWSVKNQARMHLVNSDEPYNSTLDAIKYWPETATAIAIRINQEDEIEFSATHWISDLIEWIVRPTPHFLLSTKKMEIYKARITKKQWNIRRPKLRFVMA